MNFNVDHYLFELAGLILSVTHTLKKTMLQCIKGFEVWPATLFTRTLQPNSKIKAMLFPMTLKNPSGIWADFQVKDSSPQTFTHLSSYWLASSFHHAQVLHLTKCLNNNTFLRITVFENHPKNLILQPCQPKFK